MRLLIVGGAGYVGRIIVPALETAFECTHFDLKPVAGAEERTIVGDVGDDLAVQQAVVGIDAILYLAMGWGNNSAKNTPDCNVIGPAFDVNVRGLYRFLYYGLAAGSTRFVYTSTMSVYNRLWADTPFDESKPADCWIPYGLSKRVGEFICQSAQHAYPGSTISVLRLIRPSNETDWPPYRYNPQAERNMCGLGPNDTRRLYLAVLRHDKPGYYVVQASGDMEGRSYPNTRVYELFGWKPENE